MGNRFKCKICKEIMYSQVGHKEGSHQYCEYYLKTYKVKYPMWSPNK